MIELVPSGRKLEAFQTGLEMKNARDRKKIDDTRCETFKRRENNRTEAHNATPELAVSSLSPDTNNVGCEIFKPGTVDRRTGASYVQSTQPWWRELLCFFISLEPRFKR